MIIQWTLLIFCLSLANSQDASSREDAVVIDPGFPKADEPATDVTSTTLQPTSLSTKAPVKVTDSAGGFAVPDGDDGLVLSVPSSSEDFSNDQATASRSSVVSTAESITGSSSSPPTAATSASQWTTSTDQPTTSSTGQSSAAIGASDLSQPITTTGSNIAIAGGSSQPNVIQPRIRGTLGANASHPAVATPASNVSVGGPVTTGKRLLPLNITVDNRNITFQNLPWQSVIEETTPAKPATVKVVSKKFPSKRPLSELLSQLSSRVTPPVQIVNLLHQANQTDSVNASSENGTNAINTTTSALSDAELKSLPSPVRNVRVTAIGYTGKPVHTFNLTENQVLYQVRAFWLEPENWRDRNFRPPNRQYELFCWLSNDGAWIRDLLKQNFSAAIFMHAQWAAFPEVEDDRKANFTIDCGVRAINSGDKASDWTFGAPAELSGVPVFLRGFDNVNVRGWSPDEVTHLVRATADSKRRDAPLQAAKRRDAGRGGRNCAN